MNYILTMPKSMIYMYLYIICAWDTRGQGQLNWFRLVTEQPAVPS